jgi:putative peptidoglycan lipid II flippase
VAAVVPFALLSERAGATATLRALGIGSSLGMTTAGVLLSLLVARAWGPDAVKGAARTAGVVVGAGAAGGAVGAAVANAVRAGASEALGGTGAALVGGLVAGSIALLVCGGVVAIADRETMTTALRRSRAVPDPEA